MKQQLRVDHRLGGASGEQSREKQFTLGPRRTTQALIKAVSSDLDSQ